MYCSLFYSLTDLKATKDNTELNRNYNANLTRRASANASSSSQATIAGSTTNMPSERAGTALVDLQGKPSSAGYSLVVYYHSILYGPMSSNLVDQLVI